MLARTPQALRKRRYRRRRRDGKIVLTLEVDECELVATLIDYGWLSETESTQRDALARATEGVLREMCERWRRHKS